MSDEESRPVGRPTKYKPEYCEQVRKLALLGLTDEEMAEYFEVSEQTFNAWKTEFPEFLESIHAGKVNADAEVATSLYDRAKGAEWEEDQAFKCKKVTYENGKKVSETEEIQTVKVRKAAPPDTQAASLWLRNRRPKKWRDTQHVITEPPKDAPTEFSNPEEAERAYSEHMRQPQP